jgi:hypothetical protein
VFDPLALFEAVAGAGLVALAVADASGGAVALDGAVA